MPGPITKATVNIKNGRQAGACFSLTEGDKRIIGRDNSCHIQVLDKGISRNHSLIEHKGDHFLLVDLGSTNGTFVNNKIIISKILEHGDVVKIGQTELLYEDKQFQGVANKSHASFVQDELSVHSPNTIMGRVDNEGMERSLVDIKSQGTPEAIFLTTIYEVSSVINAEQNQEKLFSIVMDKIMHVFQPDRAFVVVPEDNGFRLVVTRDRNKSHGEHKLSSTVLNKTIREGVSVLSGNAMLDDQLATGMSIVTQQIKSVMSVPLESQNKILGAIYLDSLGGINRFKKEHLDLLTAIGKQAGVAIERAQLVDSSIEKEKLKQAMEIAQKIQRSLLPASNPDGFEFDLVGWNRSCDETGGDYYDFFSLPSGKLAFAIGDVTGHGIGSAFLSASARAFLKALAIQCKEIVLMINELNVLLEQDMDDDKFMTLFYGELDPNTLHLRYANAGHDNPLLYRKSRGEFEFLESTGIPLGMMDDFEYEEGEPVQIELGDILVLSTDGITEAMNEQGQQFGEDRFVEIIRRGSNKSANQIIRDVYDSVQKFCGTAPQRDDLTLVVIKFDRRFPSNKPKPV